MTVDVAKAMRELAAFPPPVTCTACGHQEDRYGPQCPCIEKSCHCWVRRVVTPGEGR